MKTRSFKKTMVMILVIAFVSSMSSLVGIMFGACVAEAAANPSLWIGGTKISQSNMSGDGWSYDASSNTLFLDGYSYSGEGYNGRGGVYYEGSEDLTISLAGENSITTTSAYSSAYGTYGYGINNSGEAGLSFTGNGVLTVDSSSADANSYAIYSKGSITFKEGTIIARGGATMGNQNGFSYGIYCDAGYSSNAISISFAGGTVDAAGGQSNNSSHGIYCGKSAAFNVSSGSVTATGGTASSSYGIYCSSQSNGFLISGGSVNAVGGDATTYSNGIILYGGNMTVNGGSVTATGGEGRTGSYGIFGQPNQTILTIGNDTSAFIASGGTMAADIRKLQSSIPGMGWTDESGTTGQAMIAATVTNLYGSYKKIQYPSLFAEVSGYNNTYDGSAHSISVTPSYPAEGVTVKYGTESGIYELSEAPSYSDSGTYPVYFEISAEGFTTYVGSEDVVITNADQEAPSAPTKMDSTSTSIKLMEVNGCEYSKDGTSWQDSPDFLDLTPDTEYTFYQRFKAKANYNVSPKSEGTTIRTLKDSISAKVTFKVINGSWNDGEGEAATADRTVTLNGHEGDALKLSADQIPAVGSKPDANYKAGNWDETPSTETLITQDTTYTYTYAADPKPSTSTDSTNQMGADGTALGAGASAAAAEKAITSMKNDKDPAGSKYGILQLKSVAQTKTSVKLTWKKATGAKEYIIYGNACGTKNKMMKLAAVTGASTNFTTILGKKVKKATYYKFLVVALDKDNKVVSSSKLIHVATKGGKVGNHKSVTVKAKVGKKVKIISKVTVKKGKTLKLKTKLNPKSKKLKVKKHVGARYESTNNTIATVSGNGVIKANAKGTCYVYVYAQNGVFKKVKVTVK